MDALSKIAEMLRTDEPHKRIAAAVVLGELKPRDPKIVTALMQMAQEPLDAYAHAALGALGEIGSPKALPALLAALGRSKETRNIAAKALAGLGPEALPQIKASLEGADPEIRAAISQVLPTMGGKLSFQMTLDGLRGQPWDAQNRVALSVRQEAKSASEAERRAMKTQVEKFLALNRTQQEEGALRAGLKILGYLELRETVDTLLAYLSPQRAPAVRIEAATALRFALTRGPSNKALRKLAELLDDQDALVNRSARDTLMTLKLSAEHAEELALLARHRDPEVAAWAIARLGALGGATAEKTLAPIAAGDDRARAQLAARALAELPGGEKALVKALVEADEEIGAQVLSEALSPLSRKLAPRELNRLREAGEESFARSVAVARRKLDPIRELQPANWAESLRKGAHALRKKDPARSAAILAVLARSPLATLDDRYAFALVELARSSKNPHPRARASDTGLLELERLADDGHPLGKTLGKDKSIDDETLYYVGFHFAESHAPERRNTGADLLEALAGRAGRTKLGKAAKNKLKLLDLE